MRVHRYSVGPIDDLEAIAVAVHADPGRWALDASAARQRVDAAPALGVAWLDSGRGATTGRSVLAVGDRVAARPGHVLPDLRAALAQQRGVVGGDPSVMPAPLGLLGWFGYELRGETMQSPVPVVPDAHRASWIRVDAALVVDHTTGQGELIALADADTADAWAARVRDLIDEASRRGADEPAPAPRRRAHWRDTDEHYATLVRRCLTAIRDGEAYQLCLTSSASVDDPGDPVEVYRRLRRSSPAHHGALITIDGVSLLSASPETFLTVRDRTVTTRPIKGTRRRDEDAERDAALAAELASDDKERAENLMIVDLMRNDLQRVCDIGTVTVTGLHEVETYAHVHQLVSTVAGRLSDGLDALDAIVACFPAGSMTGAPKRRAIDLLNAWEGAPRGIYSGAFGMLAASGEADLAMVIRSIVVDGRQATVGAGGGITALSQPEAETAEMHLKARALLAALGAQ
jgi:para-aminobenzoate synthetase component I